MSSVSMCDHCEKVIVNGEKSLNLLPLGSLSKNKSGMIHVCSDCTPNFLALIGEFLRLDVEKNVEVG